MWSSFFDPHPPYLVPEPWASMYDPDQLSVPKLVPGEHEKNPPHFGLTQEENPDFSPYKETEIGNIGFHSHSHVTEEEAKKNMAIYYGMISMMDHYIGKILDQLDTLGLTDQTIIVFTTDHGHFFGQHGLHDKGGFHYEDVLKLPFIVRYPGHIPAGKVSNSMQSLVDLAPTFLSFANLSIPGPYGGGRSKRCLAWERTPYGGGRSKRCLAWERTSSKGIILSVNIGLCEYRTQPTAVHQKTYVDERYKITVYYNRTYGEIFDLEADPQELNNLWDDPKYLDLKANLLLKYAWAELGIEPLPMPRISGA